MKMIWWEWLAAPRIRGDSNAKAIVCIRSPDRPMNSEPKR